MRLLSMPAPNRLASEKIAIIRLAEGSELPIRRTLDDIAYFNSHDLITIR